MSAAPAPSSPPSVPALSPLPPAQLRTTPLRAPLLLLLLPLTGALLLAWPVLAVGSLIPLVGFLSLPTLLSCTASLLVLLPATLHLLFAQRCSPHPSLLPRLRLLSPWANLRLSYYVLLVAYDLWRSSLVPLALETLTKRVLLLGGRDAARVVRENIVYLAATPGEARRLDVYLPQRAAAADDKGALAPVVVLLPSPSYRALSSARAFPAPLIALRLARLGACVVVPSFSPFSGADPACADGGGVERAVGETREVLRWVAERAGAYGGDSARVTLLGVGAGAHIALLALTQSAVVSARETLLAEEAARRERLEKGTGKGKEREREEEGRASVDSGCGGSGGSETPRKKKAEGSLLAKSAAGGPFLPPSSPSPAQRPQPQPTYGTVAASSSPPLPHTPAAEGYLPATYADSAAPSSPAFSHLTFYTSTSGSEDEEDPLERYARAPARQKEEEQEGEAPRPLTPGDIPVGVLSCPLWALPSPSPLAEPESRGESLSAFTLRDARGRVRGRARITGVVLVGGTYDVVKQGRWEEKWGVGEVTASLFPPRFLLIHGGRDPLVPFSQATLLRNLLVGVGVARVGLRLCKEEGGLGALASLMHHTRYSPLLLREIEDVLFSAAPPLPGALDMETERVEGKRARVEAETGSEGTPAEG
ncbi:hypothetical protein JCM10450v2_007525 [Rhodotorula kratochvilovae]